MDARFDIPLPHLDLPPLEAYAQALESLEALEQASKGVFADISRRVLEERGARARATPLERAAQRVPRDGSGAGVRTLTLTRTHEQRESGRGPRPGARRSASRELVAAPGGREVAD